MEARNRISACLLLLFLAVVDSQIVTQSVAKIGPNYVSTFGPRDGTGSAALSFLQLVRQRSNGNQLSQCPCVVLPGSDKCVAYDSRYQAVSIEEAMLTFVDQSMDPRIYEQRTGGPITPASFVCGTTECRQCVAMLAVRLRQIGLLRRTLGFPFPVPTPDQIVPSSCPRLRLSRGIQITFPTTIPGWVATGVSEGSTVRDQFSRRPRSIFARLVEQAVNEGRAAAGRPLITSVLRTVGLHSAQMPTSQNPSGGTSAGRNQQNSPTDGREQGGTSAGGGGGTPSIRPGSRENTSVGRGRTNAGLRGGTRPVGESRPRPPLVGSGVPVLPPRRPILRPQFSTPRPGNSPNFNGRDRFQQIVNNQSPRPQVIFPPPTQFQPQPIQVPQQSWGQTPQQPQFQTPNAWNGQSQWPQQSGTFNGQQPWWNGQQQFGVSPQAIGNAVGQVGNFIPNFGQGDRNNGVGFGVGGNANNNGGVWNRGFGGGAEGRGSGERQGGARGFGRKKRQAPTATVIGERFVINCVERGDAETESSDFLNLCTSCWTWRQLPDGYFPRLINELVCQEDDYCLSGWGTCTQRHRNMDVLQRVGNDWRPTSISVASCCDCKVKAGSEAHALVIGGRRK